MDERPDPMSGGDRPNTTANASSSVTTQPCDGCGKPVTIAGGIGNLWTFDHDPTGGVTLEFEADGSEHFLCFDCMEQLPEDPKTEDVDALEPESESG